MVANHLTIFTKPVRIRHHKHSIELNISTNSMTAPRTEYNRQADKQNKQNSDSTSRLKNKIEKQSIF